MIDTHCHLYTEYDFVTLTPEEIVENSIKAGVTEMWLASTEKVDIEWNLNFYKKYPKNLKCWVGWHPEQYLTYDNEFLVSKLEEHAEVQNLKLGMELSPIVGIGEIGLDFAVHPKSTKVAQVAVFESQLKLAEKYNLPVAIHCRDAFEETIEVMEKYSKITYLWHCFTLSKEKTAIVLDKFPNMYFALNSIFTYKSGEYLKESVKGIPLDKLVIETDSPFLAPRPFKYAFNTPEGVISVYKAVSGSISISTEDLESAILQNCAKLVNRNN